MLKIRHSVYILGVIGFLTCSVAGSAEAPPESVDWEFLTADTRGKDRRDDRGDDRDDRQDCRQDEGRVGDDKRDCKQENRNGPDDEA
jgi:hypothetical protein